MNVESGHVYRDTVNGHEIKIIALVNSGRRARCETENGFPVFIETAALLGPRYRLIMVPAKIDGEAAG